MPVRVCFMIDSLSRAGTETQLLALIRSLDRERVVPSLVLLDGMSDDSQALEPLDCPVLRLGLQSLVGRSTTSAIATLAGFWRRQRVDILQTYFLDSTYFSLPLARVCGIRQTIRVRNNLGYWLTDRHRRLGRLMGRLATCTLTNSEDGKRAIMQAERLHPEKIVVIENGVDLDRFDVRPLPSRQQVGIVANLRAVKNIDGLIRAVANVRDCFPTMHLNIAGEGEQRQELERLIAERGLSESVTLHGAVSDVPEFLAKQDIAVLCSHSEGMSNAVLEYMAAGRPVLATDVGANAQLVRHGVDGIIVPAGDGAALTAGLLNLLGDPAHAVPMSANARKRVETHFSRQAMVARFESFYGKLAFRRKRTSRSTTRSTL